MGRADGPGRDLPGAGAPALVGGRQAAAGGRDARAGRDGARGGAAARGQHQPALHLAQAVARGGPGFPAPAPTMPGFAAVAITPPLAPATADAAEAPSGLIEVELAG